MKVTFKTLKQQTFVFEFDETEKIDNVKQKIEKEKGEDYVASNLKLIYSGKVMEDDKALKDYNVTEKGFVVIMNRVNRAPTKEPAKTASATSTSEPKAAEKKADLPKTESPTKKESEPSASPDVVGAGSQYEENLKTIVNMGFTREKAIMALKASFNNPERAIEYLVTGEIPVMEEDLGPSANALPRTMVGGEDRGPAEGAQDPIAMLSRMPQFLQMREMVRQNPQLLSELVKQILETNPELFALISENEQRFLEFINAPADDTEAGTDEDPSSPRQVPGANPGQVVLQMTREEKDAIDRLKALGFSENMVVQAYYACDKNENAAADFLFNDQNEDDMI